MSKICFSTVSTSGSRRQRIRLRYFRDFNVCRSVLSFLFNIVMLWKIFVII